LTAQEAALLAATLPNPVQRNARQPGPGLRRLTGIYMARAASEKGFGCIRPARGMARLLRLLRDPIGVTRT
jgi:monofunctional biosynthetic peptidoglycan transglycosylase